MFERGFNKVNQTLKLWADQISLLDEGHVQREFGPLRHDQLITTLMHCMNRVHAFVHGAQVEGPSLSTRPSAFQHGCTVQDHGLFRHYD